MRRSRAVVESCADGSATIRRHPVWKRRQRTLADLTAAHSHHLLGRDDLLVQPAVGTVNAFPAALSWVGHSVDAVEFRTRHHGADGAAASARTYTLAALVDRHNSARLVHIAVGVQTAVAKTGGTTFRERVELQTVRLVATVLDETSHATAVLGTTARCAGVRLEAISRRVGLLLVHTQLASFARFVWHVTADQHHGTSNN